MWVPHWDLQALFIRLDLYGIHLLYTHYSKYVAICLEGSLILQLYFPMEVIKDTFGFSFP